MKKRIINIRGLIKQDQLDFKAFKQLLKLLDQQDFCLKPTVLRWRNETKSASIAQYSDKEVLKVYNDAFVTLNLNDQILAMFLREEGNTGYEFSINLYINQSAFQKQLDHLLQAIFALQSYHKFSCSLKYYSIAFYEQYFDYENIDIAWFYNYAYFLRFADL